MRNFQTLDQVTADDDTGIIRMTMTQDTADHTQLTMRREGDYVSISTSHGPFEIAHRPNFANLTRVMARLRPVEGLQTTTRQVGTAQAYLGLGLTSDGRLILRPTIVADATGHLSFNLALTDDVRLKLYDWLHVEPNGNDEE
jgi:hypothetical protein